jgi:Transcriptional regulators containing a DNA-binding HTH domain and an aminotransferase domain (MocR family) and their eukaryotic orthologs
MVSLRFLQQQPDPTWQHVFGSLDRNGQALNTQLRRKLVHAIETGLLTGNTRLPSSRELSIWLGIARNTVTAAYQQLIDEGFLASRPRRGIFVVPKAIVPDETQHAIGSLDWTSRFATRASRMPQITKPRDWQSYPYPFLSGQFDPALFPTNNWRESVRAATSVQEIQTWAGDQIDDDDADLIEQLRLQVLPRRGIFTPPDELLITLGSQQALALIMQLLAGPETTVGVEDPGYTDVRNMALLATDRVQRLTVDEDGVVPDAAFAACRVAFVTPGHQCPTTGVMPLERRHRLLDAAEQHDIVLVEDDYDADLSIESDSALPSLKALDRTGRVVYVGSFSKVFAPGLRIGYVVAPRAVVEELRVLRRLMLRHPPTNNQRALATFIALGHYRHHLGRVGATMLERARLIAKLLPEVMPTTAFRRGEGATSFWLETPPQVDARVLAAQAKTRGILIEPGDMFFSDPAAGRRFFRLGFGAISTHRIEPGLRRLGRIVDEY